MTSKRAYSYLRFSTPEQQRGDSFRRQTVLAERYAEKHGLVLDNSSFQDLGLSAFRGANATTGGLGQFLAAIQSGAVEAGSFLLVESLDRLSRQAAPKAMQQLSDICGEGITVVTLSDERAYDAAAFENDPMSFMFAAMIAIRAHEESVTKSKRVGAAWANKREMAVKGSKTPLTSVCPAWLTLKPDRSGFSIVSDRAQIVRRVFQEYVSGCGQHAITEALNRDGVKPFGRAASWYRSYVAKILRNNAVVGTMTPHTTEHIKGKRHRVPQQEINDYYPSIIDLKTFERVQMMLQSVPSSKTINGVQNILAALARCPRCGATMTRVSKGSRARSGRPYLVCTRAKAKVLPLCPHHSVKLDVVESAVVTGFERLADALPVALSGFKQELAGVGSQLAQAKARLSRVTEAIELGQSDFSGQEDQVWTGVSIEAKKAVANESIERQRNGDAGQRHLVLRHAALASEVQQLEAAREAMVVLHERSHPKVLHRKLTRLAGALSQSELDRALCNALLRETFNRVTVNYEDGTLEFEWSHGGVSVLQYDVPLSEEDQYRYARN